ncbi:MAG: class F sortase [Candidatus Nomurabacteria bacterium]|jgi:sortase (surface protein transpeptidase)|nr:class F sortase [Candidatus Nomurabacteria bacterium]
MTNLNKKSGKKIIFFIVTVILVLLVAAAVFLALRYINNNDNFHDSEDLVLQGRSDLDTDAPLQSDIENYTVAAEKPRYLSIPTLGINNARVVELGLSGSTNQLDDPTNINDAGWYTGSALPGRAADDKMAGLYDGHNTGYNAMGIFYRLNNLQIGDEIIIERGDGEKFTYAVAENQMPLLEDVDMRKMLQPVKTGTEGLNIITCGGDWDKDRNTYTHRVTIRASLK